MFRPDNQKTISKILKVIYIVWKSTKQLITTNIITICNLKNQKYIIPWYTKGFFLDFEQFWVFQHRKSAMSLLLYAYKISTKFAKVLVIIKHNWDNNTDTLECSVIEASDSVCDCLLIKEAINPLSTVIIWGIGD